MFSMEMYLHLVSHHV